MVALFLGKANRGYRAQHSLLLEDATIDLNRPLDNYHDARGRFGERPILN
jgi:hypothetical protein